MMKIRKIAAALIAALTIGAVSIAATVPASASTADGYYLTTANTFLSLRTGPGTEYTEIDRLGMYTNVHVEYFSGNWAYVYVPSRNENGYVYSGYLTPAGTGSSNVKTCCVATGYLALRTAPSYDDSNEIAPIWAGQQVEVQWYTNNGYAYVYAPTVGCCGYVNASYIC